MVFEFFKRTNERRDETSRKYLEGTEKHNKKIDVINAVAGVSHDEWRKPRWREQTKDYDPRLKDTKDTGWSERHRGAKQVDIANTAYVDLPSDWQAETKASVTIAANEVEKAIDARRALDDAFIDEVAEKIHDAWLQRNGAWAPAEQKLPYPELSEEEREKDRKYVKLVIAEWQKA